MKKLITIISKSSPSPTPSPTPRPIVFPPEFEDAVVLVDAVAAVAAFVVVVVLAEEVRVLPPDVNGEVADVDVDADADADVPPSWSMGHAYSLPRSMSLTEPQHPADP